MFDNKDTHQYDDIINLPHHQSTTRPHMSNYDRAAQFSPFAALTGHEEAIEETARLTDWEMEIDEGVKEQLNEKLQMIEGILSTHPKVTIKYFQPDIRKDGGRYVTISGVVKKIDHYEQVVLLEDGTEILINRIIGIDFTTNERSEEDEV